MSTITFDFRHYYRKGERRESDQIAYQWDLGHVAEIYVPVNATYEIHYCFADFSETDDYEVESITAAEDGGYKLTAHIPNELFERSGELKVYVIGADDNHVLTTYEGYITIRGRTKPEDYVDDDPENEATRILTEAREARDAAVEAAEQAEAAASQSAAQASIADVYDATKTYAIGDYCLYDGQLYECTAEITTPEAWTAAHWTAATVGTELNDIKGDVTGLKEDFSDIEGMTLKLQSSTVTPEPYTATSTKRIRLNASPIQSNIILGSLSLVANDDLINGTITVELTNFVNGSYTVYASKTVSMSGATTRGELVKVCNIGITTIDETYVFIKTSLAKRFRAASGISGAAMVIGDDITSETFTTRNVAGYELMYSLYYALTTAYLQTLTDKFNDLLVDVEIPDSVLFYNVGYYFNNNTAEMESAGSNGWVVSDYIPVGNGITVTGSAYSQYRPQIVEYDATYNIVGQQKLGAIGSITKTYTPDDGVAFVRLQSTIITGNIASGTQKQFEPVPMVYHVEKDGSGDYTSLVECIAEATRRMDAVVYVGAGTWDIIDELGEDYLANMSATKQGIVLKNRVHIICSSKAYIKCLYSGSDANVINYLSAFNAGKNGFTLENADIEVANVRYCVHDERNAETDHYDNYYINCRMKNTNQTAGSRSQCIGGGLGYDGHIVIDGCTFENPLRENYGVVSYHNAHGLATDSRSLIEVKGSYFKGTNTFRAGYYGNSTVMTQCLVHGNSMGAEPYVTQENASFTNVNMEIIAWGNEIRST